KFLPPNIPLGTKFGAEPRTRRKAARTLSAPNFPVGVPSIRTCRLDGTFLTVWFRHGQVSFSRERAICSGVMGISRCHTPVARLMGGGRAGAGVLMTISPMDLAPKGPVGS